MRILGVIAIEDRKIADALLGNAKIIIGGRVPQWGAVRCGRKLLWATITLSRSVLTTKAHIGWMRIESIRNTMTISMINTMTNTITNIITNTIINTIINMWSVKSAWRKCGRWLTLVAMVLSMIAALEWVVLMVVALRSPDMGMYDTGRKCRSSLRFPGRKAPDNV